MGSTLARSRWRLLVAVLFALSMLAIPRASNSLAKSKHTTQTSAKKSVTAAHASKKKCKKGYKLVKGKCKKKKKATPTPTYTPIPAPTVTPTRGTATTYTNPLNYSAPGVGDGVGQVCADPSIIYDQTDKNWYVFCTSDSLNDKDNFTHLMAILQSPDLVHWTYKGDVFANLPSWVKGGAG